MVEKIAFFNSESDRMIYSRSFPPIYGAPSTQELRRRQTDAKDVKNLSRVLTLW
jgi:hypothetical protein